MRSELSKCEVCLELVRSYVCCGFLLFEWPENDN